jgi:hypothetical protein
MGNRTWISEPSASAEGVLVWWVRGSGIIIHAAGVRVVFPSSAANGTAFV